MYDSYISQRRFFGLIFWLQKVDLYTSKCGTNNFNKCHEVFHHFCSEMQTVKVIKCQFLNEAEIVTPNLTKQKEREETSPNPDVKKVIYNGCCCFFFFFFFLN